MVLAGAAMVGVWLGAPDARPPVSEPAGITPAAPSSTVAGMVVHVSGWVRRPGLVRLDGDARVADAVAAAGGVRPGASLAGINLAAPVADGGQVVVPGPGDEPPAPVPESGSGGPIRVNQASPEELETLPGVGPVLAGRIVDHRERNGGFETPEDLLEVPGIGERTLQSLRDLIQVP